MVPTFVRIPTPQAEKDFVVRQSAPNSACWLGARSAVSFLGIHRQPSRTSSVSCYERDCCIIRWLALQVLLAQSVDQRTLSSIDGELAGCCW